MALLPVTAGVDTAAFAAALADEQVEEAVVHLGDEDSHALALGAVGDLGGGG